METTLRNSLTAAVATGAIALALMMALLGVSSQTAHAAESTYCWGSWVAPKNMCVSNNRWFNAQYGQGTQGSVCVGNGYSGAACSGGPAPQAVYHPVGTMIYQQAWISNNMWNQNNQVYGITFTP